MPDTPNNLPLLTVMNESDRVKFGITEKDEIEITEFILRRVGYVFAKNGRGGSGIWVETLDGRTALLTARHVVIAAVLSGELSVSYFASGVARSVGINALSIDPTHDAALVYPFEPSLVPERLSVEDWDPAGMPAIHGGAPVISTGVPGEFKATPNVELRKIDWMKTLLYWTAVIDPERDGAIVCDVDESNPNIPKSFRGISGGPLFDINRRLLGVNWAEKRRIKGGTDGVLRVTPRSVWGRCVSHLSCLLMLHVITEELFR